MRRRGYRSWKVAAVTGPPITAPYGGPPLRSFWMGGFEGADHVNGGGHALDMARANGHVERAAQDYQAAAALGLRTVRESVGWRVSETAPGCLHVERLLRLARAAQDSGVQVLWTLMHYGTPPWVSLHHDDFVDRFARFSFKVARALARWHPEEPPIYTPINEIGFLAWAATTSELLQTDAAGQAARADGRSVESGYRLKRRLVRGVIAAMDAIRAADPRARFMHVEPVVHVAAPVGEPDYEPLANQIGAYQWQVFDMLCGREAPEPGGGPGALDLIGKRRLARKRDADPSPSCSPTAGSVTSGPWSSPRPAMWAVAARLGCTTSLRR